MYDEASHVFYMENLFIRVNLGGRHHKLRAFEGYFPRTFRVPILSWDTHVLACKRHVMELGVSSKPSESHDNHSRFIFAGDDLPIFSETLRETLVAMDSCGFLLNSVELSIIIGDEVGTVGDQSRGPERPMDGNPRELLDAATKNAKASRTLANESSGLLDESNVLIYEHMKGHDSTMISKIREAKSRWSQQGIYIDNCRVRSLLEPLRLLYDLGNLYIDAPISKQYWLAIFTGLSRAKPSVHILFAAMYTALNEAVAIYDAGDMAFAILKLKGVMDTVNNFRLYCGDEELSTVVVTGQYTGLTYSVAHAQMQCLIWRKLARASLNFFEDPQQVRTAWKLLTQRVIVRCRCYQLGGKDVELQHDNVSTLIHMAWEALDQLGEYNDVPRSHALRVVVSTLRNAIWRESDNAMLKKELQRRLKELQEAERVEDIRKVESDECI